MAFQPLLFLLLICCYTTIKGVPSPMRCGPVPQVPHATADSENTSVGTKIRYTCDDDYIHTGPRKANRCKNDLTWTDNVVCSLNAGCDLPKPPPNAYFENLPDRQGRKYPVGTLGTLTCTGGYYLEGRSRITCEEDYQWTPTSAICVPVGCGNPGDIWHGTKDSHLRTVATRVNFRCDPGYTLTGSSYRICLADGTWTGTEPTCVVACCGHLTQPAHSSLSSFDNCYSDAVTFTCDSGYSISGTSQLSTILTCQGNGQWDIPMPECQVVRCPEIDLPNGNVRYIGHSFASYIRFSCHENTTPEGKMIGQCQENGEWTVPIPKCQAHCKDYQLGNGNDHWKDHSELGYVPHNTKIRLFCNSRYVLSKPDQTVTCNNGTWEGSSAFCKPAPCEMDWSWFEARIYRFNDESITSGQSIESGTIMNATCQYGYEGRMYMVECGYGKLTVMNPPYSMEKPPPCNRIKCYLNESRGTHYKRDYHNFVTNGYVEHGDTVDVQCDRGFRNIMFLAQCEAGSFTPQLQPCKEIFCKRPTSENAYLLPSKDEYPHDVWNSVEVECREGFRPEKPAATSITCNDGTWDKMPTNCTDRCGLLNGTGIMYVNHNPGDTVASGTTVQVTCQPSYKPVNGFIDSITCRQGWWDKLPRPCQSMYCPRPSLDYYDRTTLTPDNAMYKHGEKVTVGCISDSFALPYWAPRKVTCNDTVMQVEHCKPAPCYVKQVNGTRYEQFRNVRFEGQWIDSFKTLYAFCEPGYKSARGVGNYATCDRGNLNLLVCSKQECNLINAWHTTYTQKGSAVQSAYHGDVIEISCSPGWVSTINMTTCNATRFDPPIQSCKQVLHQTTTPSPAGSTPKSQFVTPAEQSSSSPSSDEIGSGSSMYDNFATTQRPSLKMERNDTSIPPKPEAYPGDVNQDMDEDGANLQRPCERESTGKVDFKNTGFAKHNDSEVFYCKDSFTAVGLDEQLQDDFNYILCFDGNWKPMPVCRDPAAPISKTIQPTFQPTYRPTVQPTFQPTTNSNRHSSRPTTPQLTTLNTQALSCSRVSSGKVQFIYDGDALNGEKERFRCLEGYIAEGLEDHSSSDENYVRCIEGSWEPTPTCTAPQCEAKDSDTMSFARIGLINSGVTLRYSCTGDTQTLEGRSSGFTTCKEGSWEPNPQCNRPGCYSGMARYRWSYCEGEPMSNGWLNISERSCINMCSNSRQCDGFEIKGGSCLLYPDCDKGQWKLYKRHYVVYLKKSWC